jgi:hypothetical protein
MNLFNKDSINEYSNAIYREIISEIERYSVPNKEAKTIAKDLLEKFFKISVPILNEDFQTELVLENSNGQKFEPEMNADYGHHHDVYATGIYSCTYKGDDALFDVKPTNGIVVNNASVHRGKLTFKIRTSYVRLELPQSIEDSLRRNAIEAKNNILNNLELLKSEFAEIYSHIENTLTGYIDNKKNKNLEEKKRNQRINPF